MTRTTVGLLSLALAIAACGGPGPGTGNSPDGDRTSTGTDFDDGNSDDENGFDDGSSDNGSSDDSDVDDSLMEGVTYRLSITGGSMAGTYEDSYFSACVRDYPSANNFNMHTLGEGADMPSIQLTVADESAAGSGEGTDEFHLFIVFVAENGDTTGFQLGRDSSGELGGGGRAAVDQQATTASVHVDGIATTVIVTSTKTEMLDEGVRVELEADCHGVNSPS